MPNSQLQAVPMEFQSSFLAVIPDKKYAFLMSTEEVAKGYDCSINAIHSQKQRHTDEILENTHFLSLTQNAGVNRMAIKKLFWTKRGVIRLGMFIKSQRAIKFRDWAENLIIDHFRNSTKKVAPCSGICRFRPVLEGVWSDGKTRYITPEAVEFAVSFMKERIERLLRDKSYIRELKPLAVDIPIFGGTVYDEEKASDEIGISLFGVLDNDPFDKVKKSLRRQNGQR